MNFHTIWYGASQLGAEVISTEIIPDDDDQSAFYGNVNFIEKVYRKQGLKVEPIAHVPEQLLPFAGRSIECVTLKQAFESSKVTPVFIKPIPSKHKFFTGCILNSDNLLNLVNYNDDDLVLMSPVINIVSEFRCFVHKKQLQDARCYHGDFSITPDYSIVKSMVREWSKSPCAYSLDVGVTNDGQTVVIECNDVECLGWYGLNPIIAANMVFDRWEEIYQSQ